MREGIGGADGSRDVRLVRTGRGAFQVANLISARGFVNFKDSLLTCEVDKLHNLLCLPKIAKSPHICSGEFCCGRFTVARCSSNLWHLGLGCAKEQAHLQHAKEQSKSKVWWLKRVNILKLLFDTTLHLKKCNFEIELALGQPCKLCDTRQYPYPHLTNYPTRTIIISVLIQWILQLISTQN